MRMPSFPHSRTLLVHTCLQARRHLRRRRQQLSRYREVARSLLKPLLVPARHAAVDARRFLHRHGRLVLRQGQRLHIGLRELSPKQLKALVPVLERELAAVPAVLWARVQPSLKAVVVHHRPVAVPDHDRLARRVALAALEKELLAVVAGVEVAQGLAALPFPRVAQPDHHPGDWIPLAQTLMEIALDLGSLAGSLGLRLLKVKPMALETDLAAVVEVVSNIPGARSFLERHVGVAFTEFGLGLAGALLNTVLNGEIGAANSTLSRLLRWRELRARRRLWRQTWEPRLCAARGRRPPWPAHPPRPRPLAEGAGGRYASKAGLSSLGAFAGTLFATGKLGSADAAIFAGMPKPARLAEEAFGAALGRRLARAGVMVMEPQVLRLLDRLDRVVIATELLQQDAGATHRLLEAVAAADLHCVAVGEGPLPEPRMRRIALAPADAVRQLQHEGHGVLYLGYASQPPVPADCSLALWSADEPLLAGAHIYAEGDLAIAVALLQAVQAARLATEQTLQISLTEVVFGIALSTVGEHKKTARRIMTVVSATSIIAMANSLRLAHAVHWPQPVTGSAPPPWHLMRADEVLAILGSRRTGLAAAEAVRRYQPPPRAPSLSRQLLRTAVDELRNPMTPLLGAGAVLSLVSGAAVDAALIVSVMLVNSIYGASQRLHSERLIRELSRREALPVTVRRDGIALRVPDQDLVPGDVVELVAGDVVPADCRLLQASALEVDESSLTGESLPVAKRPTPSRARHMAERHSMLYDGSAISAGSATAVVVAVGLDTEANRATRLGLDSTRAVSAGVEARLEMLTRLTGPLAALSGFALASVERLRGRPLREVMSSAVSLAVAAVPEGLPLLAGLAQLAVAGRLSKRGALVRNPRAIEALGRINVLCADKTGTLTQGRIRLVQVSDGRSAQAPDALDENHRRILGVAMRASPSTSRGEKVPHLTDRALIEGAREVRVGSHDELHDWRRLDELPFTSGRAFHASLAEHRHGRLISVKGAPEVVLPRCVRWRLDGAEAALDEQGRQKLLAQAEQLAAQGNRVLAVAERPAHEDGPVHPGRVRELAFHGFVAFADVLRSSAKEAMANLQRAGVRVVMLTGDHPRTAAAIAAELGLDGRHRVVTGAELEAMNDADLVRLVPDAHVFARVTPAHKVRIVQAFQAAGCVIGMTGDGVNDAQAIRLADVGIALGEHSTRAARHAADMVVADGRIETIVGAVLDGRALWLSVRDAVALLVGGNMGEILFTLAGGLTGGGSPLNARQLLLVNLLTDAVPALAVALRPPRGKSPEELLQAGPDTCLGRELQAELGWRAGITASAAGAAWLSARVIGGRRGAGTVALLALTGAQLAQTLVAGRGDRTVTWSSLAAMGVLVAVVETPGLSQFFGCRPLGPIGLTQAAVAAAAGGLAQWLLPPAVRGVRRRLLRRSRLRARRQARALRVERRAG